MPIVPNGLPAWVRNADHTTYGGHTEKTNYLSQGKVNARTDVGAEEFCRMAADLAAVVRTAPWAVLTVQCDDTTPAAPTVLTVAQMTGHRNLSYLGSSPPSGYPTVTRQGNSYARFAWASSYTDPYGVAGTLNIVHATITPYGSTALIPAWSLVDAHTVDARIFTTAGSLTTNAKFTLRVWTGQ
jgi:hypothetical protein